MDDQFQQTQVLSEEQLFANLEENELEERRLEEAQHGDAQQHAGPALRTRKFSSLSKDEQEEEEKKYKAVKARNSFVKASELNTPYMQKVLQSKKKIGKQSITQQELMNKVKGGDYSHMQQLDPVLRNRVATEYMLEHPIKCTPEEFVGSLKLEKDPVSAMLNPVMRMGISLVINSKNADPTVIEKYRKIDDLLNKEIMIATITKRKSTIFGQTEEDLQRNIRSQVFIMKTLLSSHLGKMQLKKEGGNPPSQDWPYSVANAYAHCSRVVINFPKPSGDWTEEKEDRMLSTFYGNSGFFKRGGATHNLERKRKDHTKGAKEQKSFTPFNQYGMNVAVGGLGNAGIPSGTVRRLLKNDGSCGHLFMHFEKGNAENYSGALIGFESDAYGVMNQTGHVHDLLATGEFASSFGGQRCDEIGDKYGGREVDLTSVNAEAYEELMNLLDEAATNLLMSARVFDDDNYIDPAHQGEQVALNEIAEQLCGNLMDEKQMKALIRKLCEFGNVNDPEEKSRDLYKRLYRHN